MRIFRRMHARTRGFLTLLVAGALTAGLALASGPAADAKPGPNAPTVKVLSTGKGKKQKLRYQLTKGLKQTLVTDMTMDMQMKTPQMPLDMKMPTMRMIMKLEVSDKLGADEARYKFELTDVDAMKRAGVQEFMVEAMKTELAKAKGMSGTAIVDTRGFNRDATVDFPAGVDANTRQIMQSSMQGVEQMSTPLPAEAVGVGARWEVRQKVDQNGMTIDQVSVFELVELKGDRGTMKVTVKQSAPRQKVAGGMGGELLKLESKGTGTIEFDLGKLVPRSSMTLDSDYQMEVQGQKVDAHMDMSVEISSK